MDQMKAIIAKMKAGKELTESDLKYINDSICLSFGKGTKPCCMKEIRKSLIIQKEKDQQRAIDQAGPKCCKKNLKKLFESGYSPENP